MMVLLLIIWLFTGFLNRSYEFYEPELCVKFPPSTQLFLSYPDLPDHYSLQDLPEESRRHLLLYNKYVKLNDALGIWSVLIPASLIQLFLFVLFSHNKQPYKSSYFMIDSMLFIVALAVLIIGIYTQKPVLLLLSLPFNYLLNHEVRNYLFASTINRVNRPRY